MKNNNDLYIIIIIIFSLLSLMLANIISYSTGEEKGSQACAIKYGVGRYDAVSGKFVYDNVKEK